MLCCDSVSWLVLRCVALLCVVLRCVLLREMVYIAFMFCVGALC